MLIHLVVSFVHRTIHQTHHNMWAQLVESGIFDGVIDIPESDWIFDYKELEDETPSRLKNIAFQDEILKRMKGVLFIFNSCKQLRLSRSIALTAATLLHRFYMLEDLKTYHYYEVSATSIFVACKAEECRRNLKDVVKICCRIATGKNESIDEDDKLYWRWKDIIVRLEQLMLQRLNFDVTPINPYKITLNALMIEAEPSVIISPNKQWESQARAIFQHCTYIFELFSRLPLCLLFSTHCICALTILLSAKKSGCTFPPNYIGDKLEVSVNDIISCHQIFIRMAKFTNVLEKHYRILHLLPPASSEELGKLYEGTEDSSLYKQE